MPSYPQHVIERAKSMYIIDGQSFNEIAKILKSEYPTINAQTIMNWANKKDKHGEMWEDKRRRKEKNDENKMIITGKAKRKPLVEKLLEIQDKTIETINVGLETGTQKVTISDIAVLQKLIEATQLKWDPKGIAEQLLNIFYEDPILAKALEKRAAHVLPKMSKLFGHTEKELNEAPE